MIKVDTLALATINEQITEKQAALDIYVKQVPDLEFVGFAVNRTFIRKQRADIKELKAQRDEWRDTAEQQIADNGYDGYFGNDKWYCISHAIDVLWEGDYTAPLLLAIGDSVDLRDKDGKMVEAWHEESLSYESAPGDVTKHGIYCQYRGCHAAILTKDSEW